MSSPVPLTWASRLHLNTTSEEHLTTSWSGLFLPSWECITQELWTVGATTVTLQTALDHPWEQPASFYSALWIAGSLHIFPGLRESQSVPFFWHLCLVAWNLGNMHGLIMEVIHFFCLLWESKDNNYQTYYHLQGNYKDLDPSATF